MAAIAAAREGAAVTVFDQLDRIAAKVRASGGGRCNLANTLSTPEFIRRFGRNGKFMLPALQKYDQQWLRGFFAEIGVETQACDGFRVFPVGHDAEIVVNAFNSELKKFRVSVLTRHRVEKLLTEENKICGLQVGGKDFAAEKVIVATGGKGYPVLGGSDLGYQLAAEVGHKIEPVFPAMLPLKCRETWVSNCRADTIGKAIISINLPTCKKLQAQGDLIFTRDGIRGPVVLDFAREITPLLEKFSEVPILLNLVGGLNEEQVRQRIMARVSAFSQESVLMTLSSFLPQPLALELCRIAGADFNQRFKQLSGPIRENLIKTLVATPLTINGHEGFAQAMVTRGGVCLKEVNPQNLESRLVKGLFFCGEILDLDGPCGGFNLQWAFSSGFLAGLSAV